MADNDNITRAKSPEPSRPPAVRPEPRTTWFNSIYADITGIALTIASGIGAGVMIINKNFFKNAEKEDRFKRTRTIRDDARKVLKEASLPVEEWLPKVRKIESEYDATIKRKIKEMGVKTPVGKWRSLRHHQKNEVMLTAAAVTAGAIIGIGSIVSGREIMNKQKELEERLNEMDNGKQR